MARPGPIGGNASEVLAIDVIDVSRVDMERTFLQALMSFAAAAGIALLVPFVIILLAAPIGLAVRAALELIAWMTF